MCRIIGVPAEGSIRSRLSTEIHIIQDVGVGSLLSRTLELFLRNTRNWYGYVSLGLTGNPRCGWCHWTQLDHVDPIHWNGYVTTSGQSTVDTAQEKKCYCLQWKNFENEFYFIILFFWDSLNFTWNKKKTRILCTCHLNNNYF